ncbi:MAG: hypothetical protein AMJ69_02815 [Gammaproteobacteria bacterium SG8_47]|nr:MAG: hypothetical protein AMJ69_02815 [Gammaproteobacteria bacterium SG8_47]
MPGLAAGNHKPALQARWADSFDDAVTDLVWSSDKGLVAASASGWIKRYTADGAPVAQWQGHRGGVVCLRLQPEGELLASAGEDGKVKLWNQSGEVAEVLVEESGWIEHLEWTPDGRVLAAGAERTIHLWKGRESLGVWYDPRRRLLAMAWAPDGKRLATASNKGIYVWRLGGDAPVQLLEFPGAPLSVAWSRNGRALAVGTQDGFLQIWRREPNGKAKQLTMRGYLAKVVCLAWHPHTPLIASAGGKDVVLWNLIANSGANRATPLKRHTRTITKLAYEAHGRLLASGDREGRVCLWRDSGELEEEWLLGSEVTALQWCAEQATLAVGTSEGRVHVYAGASR